MRGEVDESGATGPVPLVDGGNGGVGGGAGRRGRRRASLFAVAHGARRCGMTFFFAVGWPSGWLAGWLAGRLSFCFRASDTSGRPRAAPPAEIAVHPPTAIRRRHWVVVVVGADQIGDARLQSGLGLRSAVCGQRAAGSTPGARAAMPAAAGRVPLLQHACPSRCAEGLGRPSRRPGAGRASCVIRTVVAVVAAVLIIDAARQRLVWASWWPAASQLGAGGTSSGQRARAAQ
jgi:hypothetical protein